MPNMNSWVDQILRNGAPDGTNEHKDVSKSCVIKLYDQDTNAFKLNDQITFIGILEFKPKPTADDENIIKESGHDD